MTKAALPSKCLQIIMAVKCVWITVLNRYVNKVDICCKDIMHFKGVSIQSY